MQKQIYAVAAALAWCIVGPTACAWADDKPAPDVFGRARVHEFHLEFTAKEWDRLQQVVGGMRGPGAPPGAQQPAKPAEKSEDDPLERHKNAGFGLEFPWAHASLAENGKTYADVGIRYKGNASYMASSRGLKRNFKIGLDRYDDNLRYFGFKTINLNAGAMDPSHEREALAFAVFRAAGVPAPRTAYAVVTLTVTGKYDKEFLGLYTMIEQVDKTFLKDRFKNNKGVLMKPERLRGLEYLGDDWDRYKDRYQPKHDPSKKEGQRVIDFARLVNKADDDQFRKEIDSYLDVDEFLRFIAVNALLSNLDSFLSVGHNYYLYLNPETNKFVFIPWDMDLSFAGFPMGGSPDQQTDLSLMHPHSGTNKLIDRLLAVPEVKEKYQKLLKELSSTCFTKEKLLKEIEAVEAVIKEPLAREKKAVAARKEGAAGPGPGFGPPGGGMFGRSMDLRTFADKRTASVEAQLAGTSKGYVPTGFGPGGPGGGQGGMGPGNFMAKPLLEALDADKDGKLSKEELLAGAVKFFKECDKGKTGSITENALADGINRLMPGPPGGGPGPGGPGGFGPGNHFAALFFKRAAPDKDGKLALEKFLATTETLFTEADKDKKGKLDESTLAAAINRLLPPPRFGPPGFGPGGNRPGEPRGEEKKP